MASKTIPYMEWQPMWQKAYIAAVESSKDKFSTRVRCAVSEYLAQQGNPVSKALPGHYIAP